MPQFHQWSQFSTYWQQLQSQGSRGLLVLEECAETYQQILPALFGKVQLGGVSVNLPDSELPGVHNIKPQQAPQYLGRSHNLVIYRACDEFNVNSFCALCGTLVGASLAILIVPAGLHWHEQLDTQGTDYGYTAATVKSPFKRWWQALWQDHGGVMQVPAQAQQSLATSAIDMLVLPTIKSAPDLATISLLPEQQQLLSQVEELAYQANALNKKLLWVCGARGRGKTVAVAKALAHLAANGIDSLITSAASQTADAVLHQHSDHARYLPIDQLLQQIPEQTSSWLLVVEEAASMPQALLQALMQRFNLLVLVSSSDGYEGTGQGLSLKLPQLAARNHFELDKVELTQPIRWQEGDLLEDLIQQSFVASTLPQVSSRLDITSLNHRQVSGVELAVDSALLCQVYGLLSLAHYQTTPQDLRLLLDHPDLTSHCWLDQQGNLVGVACLMAEGNLPADLSVAIARGQRRVKGHLLAQILTQQAGCVQAAQLSMQRIQRIAVHPRLQRRGVGRFMLQQLQAYYHTTGTSQWLGSSFAAEPDVIRFWQAAGYQVVWAGQRLDAATGLPSVQAVLPLQSQGWKLCRQLQANFYHYYGQLHWASPLSQSILSLLEPSYRGVPNQLLANLVDQVANYHGNVYGVQGYLYLFLLRKGQLASNEKQWLRHHWQPHLKQKQYTQLTRQVLGQQLPLKGDFLPVSYNKRKG